MDRLSKGLLIMLTAIAIGGLAYYYIFYSLATGDDIPIDHSIPFFDQAIIAKFVQNQGYLIAYDISHFNDDKGFSISLEFAITSDQSSAMLAATNSLINQYFVIYVENGLCKFDVYESGNLSVSLQSNHSVIDGKWHAVRVERSGVNWTLRVDQFEHVTTVHPIVKIVVTDLFVGNRAPIEPKPGVSGLTGCVRHVRVNDSVDPPLAFAVGQMYGTKKCGQ